MCPAKTQISQHIRAVRSESSEISLTVSQGSKASSGRTAKTQISLRWSEFSLGAYEVLLKMLCHCSYEKTEEPCKSAHLRWWSRFSLFQYRLPIVHNRVKTVKMRSLWQVLGFLASIMPKRPFCLWYNLYIHNSARSIQDHPSDEETWLNQTINHSKCRLFELALFRYGLP